MAKLTPQLLEQTLRVLAQHNGNETHAADALGISRGGLQTRLRKAKREGIVLDDGPKQDEDQMMRDRVFELESTLRSVKANALDDEYVKRKIIGLREGADSLKEPEWLVQPERGKALPGVPTMFWSDWHAGEVVESTQINGFNSYDMAIMETRARKLVENSINLLRNHVVNPQYPGVVLALGGDMLSGDIHEELSETNEKPVMAALLDLLAVLRWSVRTIAGEFGRVFVPCVTGNHGRNTKKPRAKGRNFTNFDWLLYRLLQQAFEGDERITFLIPDGPDALFSVFGYRYLLTHGDQFRGGDSMIGALGPIIRGNKRKLSRNAGIGLEYDTMMIGHWHQYMPLNSVIVNGSLKGYDEYASANNFGFEPPTQALWLTHPQYGIRAHLPVILEDHPSRVQRDRSQWVAWHNS